MAGIGVQAELWRKGLLLLLAGNEKRLGAKKAKSREQEKISAAGKSTLSPMKAMKLQAIVRHRDSIKPGEVIR